MGSEPFDYREPTEEEHREILARRARSDKISQIMAEYLLKGYCMLATNCPTCLTVLLGDKSGRHFCVACEQVDIGDNSQQGGSPQPPATNQSSAVAGQTPSVAQRSQASRGSAGHTDSTALKSSSKVHETAGNSADCCTGYAYDQPGAQLLPLALNSVLESLEKSTKKLEKQNENDLVDVSTVQCVNVIGACAEALFFLRKLK